MSTSLLDVIDEPNELSLDISEGPAKVLEVLQNANLDLFDSVFLSRAFPSPIRGMASDSNVSKVLESIVAIPRATHLKISYASGTFPIHLLMEAMANHVETTGQKSAIESMFFLGVKLAYSETLKATKILNSNPDLSLKSVGLEFCMSESIPKRLAKIRKPPVDMLIEALSKLKSLESLSLGSIHKVTLRPMGPFPHLKELRLARLNVCETSIRNISQSPCLEDLCLDSVYSPSPHILLLTLGRALGEMNQSNNSTTGTSSRLRKLRITLLSVGCLSSGEDGASYNAFWEMMQDNNTLEDLVFSIQGKLNPEDSAAFGVPIAQALEQNRTLQRFNLHARMDSTMKQGQTSTNPETRLALIANALRSNEALRHFSFRLMGGLPAGMSGIHRENILMDPFRNVVSQGEQYVLETLSIEFGNKGPIPLTKDIQFYLDLNRAGRRQLLLGNPTQRDWLDVVIANQSDVSIVFFFLSRNPLVCCSLLGV